METKHSIAERILDVYYKNRSKLSKKKRVHFFRRAYRVTGREEYLDVLASSAKRRTIPSLKKDLVLLDGRVKENKSIPQGRLFTPKNPRQQRRYDMYVKNPEIKFFRRFLENLFHIQSMGLHKGLFKDYWSQSISLIERVDFERLYLDDEMILKVGSFTINAAYFLHHLGVNTTLKDMLIQRVMDVYFDENLELKKDLDKWDYWTFIYNLTHIIIGESMFYQDYVRDQLFVTEYFSKNIDEIIKRSNTDIISEVGLCIKLTKEETRYPGTMKRIEDYLYHTYDFDVMLSSKKRMKKEHNNCVIMLLFYENDTWYKGPDFSMLK